jgi:archaellum biogenesis ATPase FlaH
METTLLAASLRSRESFDLISGHIDLRKYSRAFQIVFDQVSSYYGRDTTATKVDGNTLKGLLEDTTRNDKHLLEFSTLVDSAVSLDISEVNVRQVVLGARKTELGLSLAQAIVEDRDHEGLLEEYQTVCRLTELEDLTEEGVEVVDSTNFLSILTGEADDSTKMAVYPMAISNHIDGGVRGGHHVVVYGMSEAGKTALMLTIAAGFARQGLMGVYFGNEDRPQDMLVRLISCLTGMTKHEILANPEAALQQATDQGLANVQFLSVAPGTPRQIEDYADRYNAKWIVVDQLRNVAMKSESRVLQLEAAATAMRNLAKKMGIAVFSVTQAGESARNKEVLDQGDVDFSNVGIPSQADVMIGIGVTPALENQGLRMISLPKNKLSGDHASFPVRLSPSISRYTSV